MKRRTHRLKRIVQRAWRIYTQMYAVAVVITAILGLLTYFGIQNGFISAPVGGIALTVVVIIVPIWALFQEIINPHQVILLKKELDVEVSNLKKIVVHKRLHCLALENMVAAITFSCLVGIAIIGKCTLVMPKDRVRYDAKPLPDPHPSNRYELQFLPPLKRGEDCNVQFDYLFHRIDDTPQIKIVSMIETPTEELIMKVTLADNMVPIQAFMAEYKRITDGSPIATQALTFDPATRSYTYQIRRPTLYHIYVIYVVVQVQKVGGAKGSGQMNLPLSVTKSVV